MSFSGMYFVASVFTYISLRAW